jgi:hypothetical protein
MTQMANRPTYPVDIAGIHRELPLFEVKPGVLPSSIFWGTLNWCMPAPKH